MPLTQYLFNVLTVSVPRVPKRRDKVLNMKKKRSSLERLTSRCCTSGELKDPGSLGGWSHRTHLPRCPNGVVCKRLG